MPEDARGRARIVQKQPGVVFGLAAVAEAMRQCGVEDVDNLVVEGQWREEVPAEVAARRGARRGRCSPPSAPRSTSSATSPGSRR